MAWSGHLTQAPRGDQLNRVTTGFVHMGAARLGHGERASAQPAPRCFLLHLIEFRGARGPPGVRSSVLCSCVDSGVVGVGLVTGR